MATKPSKFSMDKVVETAKNRMRRHTQSKMGPPTKPQYERARRAQLMNAGGGGSKVGGWLTDQIRKRPVTAGLGAANLALMFGPGLVKGLRDSLNIGGHLDRQTDRLIGAQREMDAYSRMQQRREEDLQVLMRTNTAMLAQHSPELFNQIMAGRRLPPQATVIGGEPREDLLAEVARGMSEGEYGQGGGGAPF